MAYGNKILSASTKNKNPAQKILKQDFVLRSNNYFLVANA